MKKRNLYQIEDSDRSMYVIAQNLSKALQKWCVYVALENKCKTRDLYPSKGINLICQDDELIV